MPSRDSIKKKEEIRQIMEEFYQAGSFNASDAKRDYLTALKKRFDELVERKKREEK